MSDLSEHFSTLELACKTGEPTPDYAVENATRWAQLIGEPVRELWCEANGQDSPLIVICWYRSPGYNEFLFKKSLDRANAVGRPHGGVAKDSEHLTAEGVDLHPVFLGAMRRFRNLVLDSYNAGKLPRLGGLGEYPGWLHLGLRKRPDGKLRRWGGLGFGDEATAGA